MAMMISKFNKIIKSKVVWGAFAILICVAFVGITIPGSKSRSTARRQQAEAQRAGRLFGEEVNRLEFALARRNVQFEAILFLGRNVPITNENVDWFNERAWQRLAELKKAEQLNIFVTEEQAEYLPGSAPADQGRHRNDGGVC